VRWVREPMETMPLGSRIVEVVPLVRSRTVSVVSLVVVA
jgi:hypothetical protein